MSGDDMFGGVRFHSSKERVINLLSSPLALAVAATGAGEWLLYASSVEHALWGHTLALFVCLFAPLVETDDAGLRAFVLVPLFRVVNLGMPVFVETTLYWLPVVYGTLVPAIYVLAETEGTPRLRWNLRTGLVLAPPCLVGGALLAQVEYALLDPAALVATPTPRNVLALAVVAVGFVALVEETVFRGFVQPTLVGRVGRVPGLVATNLLFGAMHSAYSSPTAIGFAALAGLAYSLTYEATDSLVVVTLLHGSANVFLFGVVPFYGSVVPGL